MIYRFSLWKFWLFPGSFFPETTPLSHFEDSHLERNPLDTQPTSTESRISSRIISKPRPPMTKTRPPLIRWSHEPWRYGHGLQKKMTKIPWEVGWFSPWHGIFVSIGNSVVLCHSHYLQWSHQWKKRKQSSLPSGAIERWQLKIHYEVEISINGRVSIYWRVTACNITFGATDPSWTKPKKKRAKKKLHVGNDPG